MFLNNKYKLRYTLYIIIIINNKIKIYNFPYLYYLCKGYFDEICPLSNYICNNYRCKLNHVCYFTGGRQGEWN